MIATSLSEFLKALHCNIFAKSPIKLHISIMSDCKTKSYPKLNDYYYFPFLAT